MNNHIQQKLDCLDEMGKFLEMYELQKLMQG